MNSYYRAFFVILVDIHLSFSKFHNQVEYPKNDDQYVYKFDLKVSYGLSMAIRHDLSGTFDPVQFNVKEQAFYKNNKPSLNCEYTIKLENKTVEDTILTLAGLQRDIIYINNQFPGPSIVVPLNSRVEITVHNKMMSNMLSMHWHGQIQNGTFFHDGVSSITQCGIGPGESYTYKFVASNLGTHWYHAHSGLQRTDGLYGAFIVYDKKNIQKDRLKTFSKNYDKEFYLIVQDWNHRMSDEMFMFPLWKNFKYTNGYTNSKCTLRMRMDDGSSLPWVTPDTIILNGKGWYNMTRNLDDIQVDVGDDLLKLPIENFEVESNKKYLFRIIGANKAFGLQVSFGGHTFKVIATDGNPIEPIENVDTLIVNSGERYDIVIETKDEIYANNYLILVKILAIMDEKFVDLKQDYFGIGLLKYKEADKNEISYDFKKCSTKTPCVTVNCPFRNGRNNRFICINADQFKSTILPNDLNLFKRSYTNDEFEEYHFNFHFSGRTETRSSINGKQFQMPKEVPFFPINSKEALVECPPDCDGDKTCSCTQVLELTPGKVIQFTFYHMGLIDGLSGTNHPIHLHGHHFYVVSYNYPEYYSNGTFFKNNKDISCIDKNTFCNHVGWSNPAHRNGNISNANLINPVLKDTIIVPVGGYVTVRFFSDNPGWWIIHCHIENHHADGMQLLIREAYSYEQLKNMVKLDEINTCYKGFRRKINN